MRFVDEATIQVRAGKGGRAHALFRQQFTKAANCGRLAALVETLARNNP